MFTRKENYKAICIGQNENGIYMCIIQHVNEQKYITYFILVRPWKFY